MKNIYTILLTAIIVLTAVIALENISAEVGERRLYEKASDKLEAHNYQDAADAFEKLGAYRDAEVLCRYAKLRASFDAGSEACVYRSYALIKAIDTEYDGTRFDSVISGDSAMIADLYRSLASSTSSGPTI